MSRGQVGALPHGCPADVMTAEGEVRRANLEGLRVISKDPDLAFQRFSEAFTLATDSAGALSADSRAQRRALAATENNLGLFYHTIGRDETAESHLLRACDLERELGSDAPSPAVTLLNLAQVRLRLGGRREEQALLTLTEALRLVDAALGARDMLPHEVTKMVRIGARICVTRGEALLKRNEFDGAAKSFVRASQLYTKLGMPEDLVKAEKYSRLSRKVAAGKAKPSLLEAAVRPESIYRGAPAASRRPASAAVTRRRLAAVDDDGPIRRTDAVATEFANREPKSGYVRTVIPAATASVQANAASKHPTAPRLPPRRPSTARTRGSSASASARSSRRPSYASDQVESAVYDGLDDRHRAAYDELAEAEKRLRAKRSQSQTERTTEAPSQRNAANAAASIPLFAALAGAHLPRPPPKSVPREHARSAARPTPQPAAVTPSQPSTDDEAEPSPVSLPDAPVPPPSDVVRAVTPDQSTPAVSARDEAAAAIIQAGWRAQQRRRLAEASALRQRLQEEAVRERLREEERETARREAAEELASRERALEARKREIALENEQLAAKKDKKRRKRQETLRQLLTLGKQLDDLQSTVSGHTVETTQYLRRSKEEARQRRIEAVVTMQAFARQRLSGSAQLQRGDDVRHELLEVWAQERLRLHGARVLQARFRCTIAVRRAEAIEAARRAAALAKHTAACSALQAVLRGRQQETVAQTRRSDRLERSIARIQSGFKAMRERASYAIRLRHHRYEESVSRAAAVLVIQHTWHFVRLKREEDRWWGALVATQLEGKPQFAASKIQAVWRMHRDGRAPRAQWQKNLAVHRAEESARRDAEARHAAALEASFVIQRMYRRHLARRQRKYLWRIRLERRVEYLERAEQIAAVAVLGGFALIVRAKRRAGDIRERARQLQLVEEWRKDKEARDRAELEVATAELRRITSLQSLGRGGLCRQRLRKHRVDKVLRWQSESDWRTQLGELLGRARAHPDRPQADEGGHRSPQAQHETQTISLDEFEPVYGGHPTPHGDAGSPPPSQPTETPERSVSPRESPTVEANDGSPVERQAVAILERFYELLRARNVRSSRERERSTQREHIVRDEAARIIQRAASRGRSPSPGTAGSSRGASPK